MGKDDDKSMMYISIVAIIAIVGMVLMFSNIGNNDVSYRSEPNTFILSDEDLSGDATRIHRILRPPNDLEVEQEEESE